MAENNSIIGERIASLLQSWSAPAYQNFDWGVALFAAGIAAYFVLPFEPSLMILAGLCFVLLTGLWLSDRFARRLYPFILILALLALGLGHAAWHTQAVSEPILPKYERSYTVAGWIEAIEKSGTGFRWQLRVHNMSGLAPEATPKRVRVKAKTEGFKAGEGVSLSLIHI